MNRTQRRSWALVVVAAVLWIAAAFNAADAGKRTYNPSPGASLAPAASDTITFVRAEDCFDADLFVVFEGDSASLVLQGSIDGGTTWFTMQTTVLDGVDGTTALQYYKPLTRVAEGGNSDIRVPPPNNFRAILNNTDSAATISAIDVQLKCSRAY